MTKDTHYHVVIWAADGRTDSGYVGVTYVDLILQDEWLDDGLLGEALRRARTLVPNKPFYFVHTVLEKHGASHDGDGCH